MKPKSDTAANLHIIQQSALLIRIGLAVVFIYAAVSSFISPEDWVGYLPPFALERFDSAVLLNVFSAYELLLAFWLLTGLYVRVAAFVTAATLAGIILANLGLLIVTFRDLGLILAAFALVILSGAKK